MQKNSHLTISYVQLRQLIGYLGIALPFACIVGGCLLGKAKLQTTLSGYYYTNMRDVFIGIIVGVSLFLITYKGYGRLDQRITTITGVFGLFVAIFPCNISEGIDIRVGVFQLLSMKSNLLHAASALTFFSLLAINSIFIFTLSDNKQKMTLNKKRRNRIYRICGIVIICGIAGVIGFVLIAPQSVVAHSYVILGIETIMLFAFGVSWLIKGETLLKDPNNR